MFFAFQPPTPEQLAEMEEAERRNEIARQDFRHSVQRFIESELTEDQLRMLRSMIHEVDHTQGLADQWIGMISMCLKMKHNICITCGVNHDDEFQETAHDDKETFRKETFLESEKKVVERIEKFLPVDKHEEYMREYHLDDVYDSDTKAFLYYKCTGIEGMSGPCGVTYPSLADRMMKKPEECSGCFARMAQG